MAGIHLGGLTPLGGMVPAGVGAGGASMPVGMVAGMIPGFTEVGTVRLGVGAVIGGLIIIGPILLHTVIIRMGVLHMLIAVVRGVIPQQTVIEGARLQLLCVAVRFAGVLPQRV